MQNHGFLKKADEILEKWRTWFYLCFEKLSKMYLLTDKWYRKAENNWFWIKFDSKKKFGMLNMSCLVKMDQKKWRTLQESTTIRKRQNFLTVHAISLYKMSPFTTSVLVFFGIFLRTAWHLLTSPQNDVCFQFMAQYQSAWHTVKHLGPGSLDSIDTCVRMMAKSLLRYKGYL